MYSMNHQPGGIFCALKRKSFKFALCFCQNFTEMSSCDSPLAITLRAPCYTAPNGKSKSLLTRTDLSTVFEEPKYTSLGAVTSLVSVYKVMNDH